ncbi:hypothetical protein ACPYO6_08110 [Georgenia sp. Z1344]|uniref:hypothetical protein n=1 Tax=Georgenia sp. Z1344 TaxID=3416706 RepID=UPI003CE96132
MIALLEPRHAAAPGRTTGGERENCEADQPIPSLVDAADVSPAATPLPTISEHDVVEHVSDALVLVLYSPKNNRFRRRVLFNLPAAQAAVRRADERGDAAWIVLSRIVPEAVVR